MSPHPRLRAWTDADYPVYTALHDDPAIRQWIGTFKSEGQRRAAFERTVNGMAERGWGIFAILDDAGAIVGAAGLQPTPQHVPCYPAVEAAWRLATHAHGKGYVTTAMRAVLPWAFANFGMDEIVTFTARVNTRSQAVMQRLGFTRDPSRDFDHVNVPEGDPLRPHVFYAMKRDA